MCQALCAEPELDEMLDDPVLLAVMARDRVTRDELLAFVARARAALRAESGSESR